MTNYIKDQIDKLTAIINSATGRKSCRPSKPSNQGIPTNKRNHKVMEHQRLGELILKMQDGTLDKKYIARLGKWLACDENALKYYVEFNQLTAMLYAIYNKKQRNLKEELFHAKT